MSIFVKLVLSYFFPALIMNQHFVLPLEMSNSRLSQSLIDDAATNRKKHFDSQSLAEQVHFFVGWSFFVDFRLQIAVEVSVESCFQSFLNENPGGFLRKDEHIAFLSGAIGHLSVEHQFQDPIKPWLAYWVLHSIALLKDRVSEQITERFADNQIVFVLIVPGGKSTSVPWILSESEWRIWRRTGPNIAFVHVLRRCERHSYSRSGIRCN